MILCILTVAQQILKTMISMWYNYGALTNHCYHIYNKIIIILTNIENSLKYILPHYDIYRFNITPK